MQAIDVHAHEFGPPRIALQATSLTLRIPVVASSDLLGLSSIPVVRQAAPRYRLTILPVKEWSWHRSVGITWRKDAYLTAVARRFIEILKTTAKVIAAGKK